jgi:hypothetical protein
MLCHVQGHYPLHVATEYNQGELVRCLLARGSPVNQTTRRQHSALHYASWKGFHQIAEWLLDAGAHVNARNASGRTPLQVRGVDPCVWVSGPPLPSPPPSPLAPHASLAPCTLRGRVTKATRRW